MSRKDYVLIAEAIKRVRDEVSANGGTVDAVDRVAGELSLAFAKENERFDMDRFLKACGSL